MAFDSEAMEAYTSHAFLSRWDPALHLLRSILPIHQMVIGRLSSKGRA